LLTGHQGYIGSVMAPMLVAAGNEVVGLDSRLFESCDFGEPPRKVPELDIDLRDVARSDLEGFDAVIHLAALSNDPLGDLNPDLTYEINHRCSVRLAELAKQAGVGRFLYASSCSLYGVAGDAPVTEDAEFRPVTPYGESKARAERDLARLVSADFTATYLRNATAYGVSPRFRADLAVNSLVGYAITTGQVLMRSDGTPWRPFIHVEDIARAFIEVLSAPRALIHNQAFNVGRDEENYQIRDVAEIVRQALPGTKIQIAEGAGPDPRCYRVDFGKVARVLPSFRPRWSVASGIAELVSAYRRVGLTLDQLEGPMYLRMKRIKQLQREGRLTDDLRHSVAIEQRAALTLAGS
jgi:nucleoside-diphosphate-sugar epimerase